MENWLVPDGSTVAAGQPVAVVQVEGEPVTLTSPISGILSIHVAKNNAVEPGTVIARIPWRSATSMREHHASVGRHQKIGRDTTEYPFTQAMMAICARDDQVCLPFPGQIV